MGNTFGGPVVETFYAVLLPQVILFPSNHGTRQPVAEPSVRSAKLEVGHGNSALTSVIPSISVQQLRVNRSIHPLPPGETHRYVLELQLPLARY